MDGAGNTFQTGYTRSNLHSNTSVGNDDIFLIRCDTTGNRVWTKQFGSTAADTGYDCALDSYGNIYVTGNVQGSIGGNTHFGSSDIFLVKLDEMSASLGRKSLYLGRRRTSSKVNALCFNFSISDYIQTVKKKKVIND